MTESETETLARSVDCPQARCLVSAGQRCVEPDRTGVRVRQPHAHTGRLLKARGAA